MRAAIQITRAMVRLVSTTDKTICQTGGMSTLMRRNIRIGVMNGMSDKTTARVESGARMTTGQQTMAMMMGSITGKMKFCASWMVFTADPIAAYRDA